VALRLLRNGLDGLVQRFRHRWSPLCVEANATPVTGVPRGAAAKAAACFARRVKPAAQNIIISERRKL
jgi:hypothetical protein